MIEISKILCYNQDKGTQGTGVNRTMLAEERMRAILEILERKRAASVAELCLETGASEATIRRDLNELDRQGKISKVHGGAVLPQEEFEAQEPDVQVKSQRNIEQKERIARYAAAQIQDDDFVFIDAGTTTLRMADYLGGSKATFVTTGIECAKKLVEKGLRVYVPGGMLKPGTQALVGAVTRESLAKYNFTKAFIGTNGVTVKQGFTTPDTEEASIKTLAVERSYLSYVLADSSKFGKVSAVTICPLSKACILTDQMPDDSYAGKTIIKEVD